MRHIRQLIKYVSENYAVVMNAPTKLPPLPSHFRQVVESGRTNRPPGRPKGSRNKRTLAIEALFEGEAEDIARMAIQLAKGGDPTSIKMILDRLAPARKGTPIELPSFPRVSSIKDVPSAHAYLIRAVAEGHITPDESSAVAATLDRYCASVETVDLEKRLADLEARYGATSNQ